MNTFWNKNRDHLAEDVAADRVIRRSEPGVGRRRLANAQEIAVDQIEADPQHREEFDETALEQLARSMAKEGQLQPIRVRFDGERGRYIIIAGERRWRAAKIAGLSHLACIVDNECTDKGRILRHQIIENALREDLKPSEQARAFADLMAAEGWTGSQLAEQLNISQPTVSRTLALLKVPADVQGQVDAGELALTAAVKTNKSRGQGTRSRPTKEQKIKTSVGITVMLKARKQLKEEQMVIALQEAINQLQAKKRAA